MFGNADVLRRTMKKASRSAAARGFRGWGVGYGISMKVDGRRSSWSGLRPQAAQAAQVLSACTGVHNQTSPPAWDISSQSGQSSCLVFLIPWAASSPTPALPVRDRLTHLGFAVSARVARSHDLAPPPQQRSLRRRCRAICAYTCRRHNSSGRVVQAWRKGRKLLRRTWSLAQIGRAHV